jgi:hypothetical protein
MTISRRTLTLDSSIENNCLVTGEGEISPSADLRRFLIDASESGVESLNAAKSRALTLDDASCQLGT